MAGDHHQTSNAEIAENDTNEGSTAVHRPRGCHNLEPSVYNVASWKQLCGLDVVIDILPALKREDSHGTAPLGWDIVVYDVTCS